MSTGTSEAVRVGVDDKLIDCSKTRLVYIDLGVNWANTLRLFKDLGKCPNATHWEIYGFEAHPWIQKYANHFVEFLNGQVPMPPKEVPPTGSSEDLHLFAKKYNCSHLPALSRHFKDCMWGSIQEQLMNLHPNPRLEDPSLLSERLHMASVSNVGARFPRYVLVPAAAGHISKTVTISFNRIGLIRGGSAITTGRSDVTNETKAHPAWEQMHTNVTQIDVATWLTSHFKREDYVVVKADIEGAEHGLFRELFKHFGQTESCLIDYLAWQCHEGRAVSFDPTANCARTTHAMKQKCPSMTITEEGKGPYNGIDQATREELVELIA